MASNQRHPLLFRTNGWSHQNVFRFQLQGNNAAVPHRDPRFFYDFPLKTQTRSDACLSLQKPLNPWCLCDAMTGWVACSHEVLPTACLCCPRVHPSCKSQKLNPSPEHRQSFEENSMRQMKGLRLERPSPRIPGQHFVSLSTAGSIDSFSFRPSFSLTVASDLACCANCAATLTPRFNKQRHVPARYVNRDPCILVLSLFAAA